jgi:hypothetical protein
MTNEELQLLSLPIIAAVAVSVFAYIGTVVVVRHEQKFQTRRKASKQAQVSATDTLNPEVQNALTELRLAVARSAVRDLLNDPDRTLAEFNSSHS